MVIGIAGIIAACIGLCILKKGRKWERCPPVGLTCADALAYLNPGKNQAEERNKHWRSRLVTGLYVLLGGSAFLLLQGLLQTADTDYTPIRQIERPEPGEGKRQVALNVQTIQGEIPLTLEVKERVPRKEEIDEMFVRSYELLRDQILGENPSMDEVSSPLWLSSYIEETACQVYWYTDNRDRIDREGMVYTEGLTEKEQVTLTAQISFGSYEKEYLFCVTVLPEQLTGRERLIREIRRAVQSSEESDGEAASFVLPEKIGGQEVEYHTPRKKPGWLLYVLVALLTGCSMLLPDQQLAQKKKEKEEELELAYPEIVSKLCLLIGSGLTVRKAWERVIQDYKERKGFNYAYEEMLFTYFELERGIPEGRAYAAFGRRCRLHGYRKLGSLLEQNLKKGTAGLLSLLKEETWQAFEDRRAFAVKLAQEAGTRLLLPMILLLGVVLVICIAPAIMSF